ncbi:MAG: insulinase family protein, partial [Rhodothermales bacterium]|nr:insulinase family protein [Rhodothermales bacterium]
MMPADPETTATADDDAPLPINPKVRVGRLANGLTYYIRQNEKPADRAELRLVVDAGSVLEDDDQRGLAHFVEHMAFNGTKKFPKQELIDYLELTGTRFGPDLNAYTSLDETVYMLSVRTDSLAQLATGLEILREWATEIVFEPDEVEKERGVVIEEWRLGRGAQARIF